MKLIDSSYTHLIKEWDYDGNKKIGLDINEVTCGSAKKALWKCSSCENIYFASIAHRVHGTSCPKCANESKTSFGEQCIYYYLKKVFPKTQNRYNDLGKEIDIFIPELSLGIEYDGEFYHRSSKALERDSEKSIFIINNNIDLIRVSEYLNSDLTSNGCTTFYINRKHFFEDLQKCISDILGYILIQYNIDLYVDVDVKRDVSDIYSLYIFQSKENSVARKCPEKIQDWDYSKNTIKPDCILPSSTKFVWFTCKKGHSYQQSMNSHIRGNGCPVCSNQKVLKGYNDLETVSPELLKDWDYDNNTIKPSEIVSKSNKKVYWKCNKGHSYLASPYERSKGRNCSICSGKQVLKGYNDLLSQNPDLASEWDYKLNEKGPDEYTTGSDKKVYWHCNKCGCSFKRSIKERNQSNRPCGCPICAGKMVVTGYNDLQTMNPELLKDWDYENNIVTPDTIYYNSMKKVYWKCNKCGCTWKTSVYCRVTKKQGCNVCSSKIGGLKLVDTLIKAKGSLSDNYPELLDDWNYVKNEQINLYPDKITSGSHKRAFWKCHKCGHEWKTEIRVRSINGGKCPKCHK